MSAETDGRAVSPAMDITEGQILRGSNQGELVGRLKAGDQHPPPYPAADGTVKATACEVDPVLADTGFVSGHR